MRSRKPAAGRAPGPWKKKMGTEFSGLENTRDFLVAIAIVLVFVAIAGVIAFVAFG